MKKDQGCMKGQIDLFSYQMKRDQAKKRKYKRKAPEGTMLPFRLYIFQKAYISLKKKGDIEHSDILEFRVPAAFDVYESLYVNALYKVYQYWKVQIKDSDDQEFLSDAYELEYNWMLKRYGEQEDSTA